MKHAFRRVDVFSSAPCGGNQRAVPPDTAGLYTTGPSDHFDAETLSQARPRHREETPAPDCSLKPTHLGEVQIQSQKSILPVRRIDQEVTADEAHGWRAAMRALACATLRYAAQAGAMQERHAWPLAERQPRSVLSATEQDEHPLQASMVHFEMEDPRHVDAEWCFAHYFAELNVRFEKGFDPAQSISAGADELVPPKGLLLVARLRGEAIGCGALKFHGEQFAEVKRMWISERLRGRGIARRLLRALEKCAAEAGVRQLRLETNQALPEAIALYRSSGFSEVKAFNTEPYAHHWFQKPVETHREPPPRARRYLKPNNPQ